MEKHGAGLDVFHGRDASSKHVDLHARAKHAGFCFRQFHAAKRRRRVRHRPTGDIAARVILLLIQSRRTRVRGGFGVRPLMVGDNCLNVLRR